MRVTLTVEGGLAFFPGLAKPSTIDDAMLPPDQAAELRRLVVAADFFQRGPGSDAVPGAADYRVYTLTVEDGATAHTVCFTDLDNDPALSNLLQFVQSLRPKPDTG